MIKPTPMLRTALVLDWVLLLVIAAGIWFLDLPLPPELQAYEDRRAEAGLNQADWLTLALFTPLILLNLASAIGLWFLRRWARLMYAVTTLLLTLGTLVGEPGVNHVFISTAIEFSLLICGFIVGLSYYGALGLQPPSAAAQTVPDTATSLKE